MCLCVFPCGCVWLFVVVSDIVWLCVVVCDFMWMCGGLCGCASNYVVVCRCL